MSETITSNNSQIPTPNHPLTARELLRELITRNLEIIETRTSCLVARSFVAYNTAKNQTFESMFDAFTDIISAPFLRLGKRYRESPITREITEASRTFNNLLITAKREAALRIRLIISKNHDDPPFNRKIQRLGLRFPIIKLDIEELIAADEADADANSNTETAAATAHPAPTPAPAQPEPQSNPNPAAQIQPPASAPVASQVQITANSIPTHPADTIIAAEIAKINAANATTSTAPTPTSTPSSNSPIGRPFNPQNKKRNRFKKRRAA